MPSPIARVWHTLSLEYSRFCKYLFKNMFAGEYDGAPIKTNLCMTKGNMADGSHVRFPQTWC